MEIELIGGKCAIVDASDYEWLSRWKWRVGKFQNTNYAIRTGRCGQRYMHTLLLGAKSEELVDHINGNGLDNRRCNLRVCTIAENARNRKKSPNKTSKYKGVSWDKRDKKWRSQIKIDHKTTSLGYYQSEVDAAKAYDIRAKELFGKFARLNF
jgi:hypothetical protein